jgi:hypothetical protein
MSDLEQRTKILEDQMKDLANFLTDCVFTKIFPESEGRIAWVVEDFDGEPLRLWSLVTEEVTTNA